MKRGGGFRPPDPAKARAARERAAERARERDRDPERQAEKRRKQRAAEERQAERARQRAAERARAPLPAREPKKARTPAHPVPVPVRAAERSQARFRREDWDAVPLGRCACGRPHAAEQRHHVVFAQEIRARKGEKWDPRNQLPVAVSCHAWIHSAGRPWPLAKLPDAAIEFAWDLMGPFAFDYLTRRYRGDDPRVRALLERPLPVDLPEEHDPAAGLCGNDQEAE